MTWLILRVFTGHPFHVEDKLQKLGFNAYCPKYTIKRRHPFSKKIQIDVTKPLFPGYLFADRAFDAMLINTRHIKTKLMARDGRYLTVPQHEMDRVKEAERRAGTDWHPEISEIVSALAEIVKGVTPQKFTRLADLQRTKGLAA